MAKTSNDLYSLFHMRSWFHLSLQHPPLPNVRCKKLCYLQQYSAKHGIDGKLTGLDNVRSIVFVLSFWEAESYMQKVCEAVISGDRHPMRKAGIGRGRR